jgi:hypothetical protein
VSDDHPVSVLHKICDALDGVSDVSVLLFKSAFFASSENRVAAERDNYQIVI